MNKLFEQLKVLSEAKEAKKSIDYFIKEVSAELREVSIYSSKLDAISSEIANRLFKVANDIEKNYSISKQITYLYFSMDKTLINKLHTTNLEDKFISFTIPSSLFNDKKLAFKISGYYIDSIYDYREEQIYLSLEQNSFLFPKSTMNYLNKKKKDRNVYDLKSLSNSFEARMLTNKLPDIFILSHNEAFYKKIVPTTTLTPPERISFRYHYYNALTSKYAKTHSEHKNYLKFTERLFDDFFFIFSSYYSDDYCIEFLKIIQSNDLIFNKIIDRSSLSNTSDSILFMLYYFTNITQRNILKKSITLRIQNETCKNYVVYNDLEPEIQEILFQQALKKFLRNNPKLSQYLVENNLTSEHGEALEHA